MLQSCNLDGISMNIQEENSACYRVQSEREQTLVKKFAGSAPGMCLTFIVGNTLSYLTVVLLNEQGKNVRKINKVANKTLGRAQDPRAVN